MKKAGKIIIGLMFVLGLSSCGVNQAWVLNKNQNNTQVQLDQQNFKVVGEVQGSAEVSYVLVFGGANRKSLYQEAYRKMTEKANLEGSSKVLTNILTEEHIGGVPPFYFKRTISLRADVIEFTK